MGGELELVYETRSERLVVAILYAGLAHALDRAHQRVLEMAGKSALEQVSRLLLDDLAERKEPTLELTQEEFAATLALSRQTISRAFQDLASEGAIKTGRRSIRLLDLDKLRAHVPR